MSKNRVIGLNNAMPWHIPEELLHFKQLTMGKPIIMGRKTFDAIGRRLLPGRKTIILTHNKDIDFAGATVVHSITQALQAAGDVEEIMIVGGSGIYKEFLPFANNIYLSIIAKEYVGDAFFPELDNKIWNLVSEQQYEKFYVQHFEKSIANN